MSFRTNPKDIYLNFLLNSIDYASHGIEHNEARDYLMLTMSEGGRPSCTPRLNLGPSTLKLTYVWLQLMKETITSRIALSLRVLGSKCPTPPLDGIPKGQVICLHHIVHTAPYTGPATFYRLRQFFFPLR